MSTVAATEADAPSPAPDRGRPLRRAWLPPAALALLVALVGTAPLLRTPSFYYWDDSAASFAPGWRVIGSELAHGTWPAMVPQLWAGGNFAAEALYGIYNPVVLADTLLVAGVQDVALAMAVVKLQHLAVLAVGVYLLCRQYRASWPMSFVAGLAMPFAGFTLYFDASTWVSGLIAFAWLPHVWWSTRSAARGGANPLLAVGFGYLLLSTGNPYGAVAILVVYLALGAELLVAHEAAALRRTVVTGAATALTGAMIYLPLLLTTAVTTRTDSGVMSNGFLVPGVGDLLNLSSPTATPVIPSFSSPSLTEPIGYLAFFLVPLLPWVRWSRLRALGPGLVSLGVVAGTYGLLAVGPSNLWLFRWPVRLVEYFQLPVLVTAAVCLSAGLARDRLRRRAVLTGALLLVQLYLSWSTSPDELVRHLLGALLVAALVAVALAVHLRRPPAVPAVLAVGTVLVVLAQTLAWFPTNRTVFRWDFPTDRAELRDRFEARYPGRVFQVGDVAALAPTDIPDPAWRDLLFGSVLHSAGVDSVNAYTGINYADFARQLCLKFDGSTPCANELFRLTSPAPDTQVPWYDALQLDTIVVQDDAGFGDVRAALPAEWDVRDEGRVTVARRDQQPRWPGSRLVATAPGVAVAPGAASEGNTDRFTYTGSGPVVLSRLAWPGWSAQVDGTPVPTGATEGGLLTLDLPPSTDPARVDVQWTTPGTVPGLVMLAAGVLLALAQGVRALRRPGSRRGPQPGAG